MSWLTAAIMSLFFFGIWGLFSKITILYIDAKSALFLQSIGVLAIAIVILASANFKIPYSLKGTSFAMLTGAAYGIGCLFYFIAADKGKVTTVVTLTALYPMITIFLSYFLLKEAISFKQYFGIAIGLLAIYLMS